MENIQHHQVPFCGVLKNEGSAVLENNLDNPTDRKL